MLWLAILFLVLAVVAGILGFDIVGFAFAVAAKVLLVVFLVLALLVFLGGYRVGHRDVM
jgi:uncharacterized membrane protein YtjA (UPF0391 family)